MLTSGPPEEPASPTRDSAKAGGRYDSSRTARWLTVACVAWVLAAATYAALRFNFERAPVVHVRWSAAVDGPTRAGLEQQFALTSGTFIDAFVAKDPLRELLSTVPVKVITNPDTGLLGAAVYAQELSRRRQV